MAVRKAADMTRRPIRRGAETGLLMDNQDTLRRGDSRAVRTRRVTFSTTDKVADALEDAAYKGRTSRSRLVEAALVEYFGLHE